MDNLNRLVLVLRHCGNPNVSCKGCPDIDDCTGSQGAWEIGAEANMRSAAEAIDALCETIPRRCECCVGCELEEVGGYCDTGFILSPVRAKAYLQSTQKTGTWTLVGYHKGIKVCECSSCNRRQYGSTDYCANCGAYMKEKEVKADEHDQNPPASPYL